MFFGPSRFLWFSIGSLATVAFMHYRRGDHCRPASQIRYDRGHGQWGAQGRSARFDEQQQQQSQQWGRRRGAEAPDNDSRFDANGGRREPVLAEASGRFSEDLEPDRIREMSRSAEETISGMSEATIDSMMGGLQRLKDRLAERRGQQLQDSQKPFSTTTPLATPPEGPRHEV